MRHMRSRRILAMLLALSMIFGLLTTTALADNEVDQTNISEENTAENQNVAGVPNQDKTDSEVTPAGDSKDNAEPSEEKEEEKAKVAPQSIEGETPIASENYVAHILSDSYEDGYKKFTRLEDAIADAARLGAADEKTLVPIVIEQSGTWDLSVLGGLGKGTYSIDLESNVSVTFTRASGIVGLNGANVSFYNVTFNYTTNADYTGLAHCGNMYYENCIFNGKVFLYGTSEKFNCCKFYQDAADYNVWTYGAQSTEFYNCGFYCVGKAVNVYTEANNASSTPRTVELIDCGAISSVKNKALLNIKNGTQAYEVTLTGNNTATITDSTETMAVYQIESEAEPEAAPTWKDTVIKSRADENTDATVLETVPASTDVAEVGGVTYGKLEVAFAALNSKNHTLTLLDGTKWDEAKPVYWAAGDQSGYAASLAAALTAAYRVKADDITIVCRPGADVGTMTHGHVADDITIYGNNAYVSGGECDLEVDTYKFSRKTGAQAADGEYLKKAITITGYELDNLGVWGQRHTENAVTINLTDCDSTEGTTAQRVYITNDANPNGKIDITLTDCDFKTNNTSVYSNADGDIKITNCTFTGTKVPVNFNHTSSGTQTLDVSSCIFTNCGDAVDWPTFAAPVRFVNSGSGTQSATVDTCTFDGTVGSNGDILIGDGRANKTSNDVSLTITNTKADIQAQKPGYYNGTETDKNKLGTATSPASGTLTTSVKTLIPSGESSDAIVDEKTLRKALFDAPTDGTQTTIKLESDITLEMLYAAENFGTEKLDDNAAGDTFNRYKQGVHPTEDDPDHWNLLVTGQSQEARLLYGAYYHMSATDERIARLVVKAGQNIVLDLNGHTIQKDPRATHGDWSNTCTDILANYGTLTITDTSTGTKGTIKGNGYISCDGAVLHNYAGATMNVGAINVDGNAKGMSQGTGQYVVANDGGTLSINGANIFDTATSASLLVNKAGTMSVKNATLSHPATKTFNVKGGTVEINEGVVITSDTYAIFVKGGTVKLNADVSIQASSETATPGTLAIEGETARVEKAESVGMAAPAGYKWENNVLVKDVAANDGSKEHPYTLKELGKMTRSDYIAAQTALGGTMYVSVGNYSYDTNGVLGNGERDDTPGQIPDHSKLNAYGENGYLGTNNDGANGLNIVFVNGSITSNVTGYTSIDNIGTSLLLAVPAYTNVTFKGITFNNVMCFNYQLYTSPWSQLGELKFDGCTFNGIIIGSIAAQTLTFNGCTFTNFTNTTDANSSNPTWIRPAYGNWTSGDNEGQGSDFRSLTKINFTNNKVTSTRPVKFEYVSQWDVTTTIKVDGNTFNISKQEKDGAKVKNVGMYFGSHTDENAFNLILGTNEKLGTTAALYTLKENQTSLPAGSTVTDLSGKQIEITDALEWKTNNTITLKTEPVSTETSIDLATFLAWAATNGWNVDGSNYTDNMSAVQDGKLVVKWSPVSGCYDTREGHVCTVNNAKATGNTPKRVNNSLTQFQILEGSSAPVTVKNVKFVYEPAAFTVCANSGWKGSFTAEHAPAGQLYFMTTGNVTFESCDFDKVVLTTFNTTGTSTVTNCKFANVYNNYAIKDIRGANVSVTGTTITNCGGGIMVSQNSDVVVSSVTLTGNTFKDVDVAGTAPDGKVGTRAILQFASSGDYAKATLDITSNKAENCGPALRQLNEGSEIKTAIKSMEPSLTSQFGENLYTSDSVKEMEDTDFFEDEQGVWHIATAAGLVKFADSVTRTNTYKDVEVVLDSNIDMSNTTDYMGAGTKDMLTTGTGEAGFEGTFDGQGHTIINLTVTNETSVYYTGLFYLLKGTVKNLTLDGAVCTGNRVAVLAGAANSCTVENVTVMNSKVNGVQKCAGLIGFIRGGCTVAIKNCTVKNVTIKGLGDDGVWQAGGLVGFINTNTNATISNNSVSNIEIVDAYAAWLKEGNAESPQYSSHAFIGVIVNTSKTADAYENYVITLTGNTVDESASGVHKNETFPSNRFCGEYADCNSKTVVGAIYPTKLVIDGEELTALPVAEVGSNQYETLQAAINAAKSGATVKLLKDTKENVTIAKALTLDLNGKTLNGGQEKGKPALTVTAKGVTVKDSSADMSGTIMREDTADNSGVSSHYVIDIQGIGWLKFESGNVINNSGNSAGKGASLVRVGDDSVEKYPGLNIKGGNFKQDNFIAIKVDRGDLFLNGGTITSANSYAIENWFRATINGGTVKGTVASWTYSGGSNSTTTITGGTIDGDVASVSYGNAEGKTAKVTISGGTVNGELDTRSYDPTTNELTSIDDAAKATIGVTGGTFDIDPTPYVVEGSTVKTNSEGKYGVEKAYLCQIGETKYYTMEEAFKAQTSSGKAILLLRDYTTGSSFSSGSINRTVDLDGHTWTYTSSDVNSAAFEVNHPNATLTVKNGKVVSNSMIGLIPTAMGGTIKYPNSGLVFEKVEATANGHSGIETNGGNESVSVTLKDSTLNVPSGFGIYFPSSGKLTIENSKITAKTLGVQVCSGSLDISGADTKIEVTGDGVEKTENDGAIQDGAAISIVNRTGYKGLGTITVTEGTFKAKSGNAAVKAYNWANQAESDFTESNKVAISGGSYSTPVAENLCAEGFVPVTTPNSDGFYEVKAVEGDAELLNADGSRVKYGYANQLATDTDAQGKTIKLFKDTTNGGFMLPAGVTLDLNGKTMTSSFLFATGDVIDSTDGAGKLVVAKELVQFQKNDTYLPLYNKAENAYQFFKYSFLTYSANLVPNTNNDKLQIVMQLIFENKAAYDILVQDPDGIHGIKLGFSLSWGDLVSISQTWEIRMPSEQIPPIYQGQANPAKRGIALTIIGLNQLPTSVTTFNTEAVLAAGCWPNSISVSGGLKTTTLN